MAHRAHRFADLPTRTRQRIVRLQAVLAGAPVSAEELADAKATCDQPIVAKQSTLNFPRTPNAGSDGARVGLAANDPSNISSGDAGSKVLPGESGRG